MSYYPKPVTKNCIKKLLDQMNNSFFKIKGKDNDIGICCFCKIEYKNKKIPVVIINKYLIDLEFTNSIVISINNRHEIIQLSRTRFRNEEFGLSIIEIQNNKIENINFIEIDEKSYEKEAEMFYNKENIYIIQIDNKNESSVSYGKLNNINNNHIYYSCNLSKNYKSFYIFNLSNNKMIGINSNNPKDSNKGIFLKYLIDKFMNKYRHNLKINNEINILIKVDKEDIKKEIYFLDNGYNRYGREYYAHNNLKELNDLNTEIYINGKKYKYNKYFKPEKEGKYTIKLKFYIKLTDCSYMLVGCKKIIDINFISFDSSLIKNIKYMFFGCNNLKTIKNLSSFNTKNVTDMGYMFYGCNNLNDLNLSSFNTENVIDMNNMFTECNNLNDLNLSSFNTENVIDMNSMFAGCNNLTDLNLTTFNTKNVISMSEIFYGCKNLKNLNLSSFDTKNVIKMNNMFTECNNLNDLNLSSFDTKNVNDMSYMFYGCKNLKILNLSSFDTKNVIKMNNMFTKCNNLNDLNLSSFNTKKITDMSYMFYGCKNLKYLNLSSFDTKNVTKMNNMFAECINLKDLNLSSFDIKKVNNAGGIFYGCTVKVINSNLSIFNKFRRGYLTGK